MTGADFDSPPARHLAHVSCLLVICEHELYDQGELDEQRFERITSLYADREPDEDRDFILGLDFDEMMTLVAQRGAARLRRQRGSRN